MPYTAAEFVPDRNTAGESAGNKRLKDVIVGGAVDTRANYGTDTAQRYIQWEPGVDPNATAGTPGAAATDKGWHILKADMNETLNTPNKRVIPSGTWTFNIVVLWSSADAGAAANTYRLQVRVYKRAADATYSEIIAGGIEHNIPTVDVGVAEKLYTFTKTGVAEQTFETDETLHIELWTRGRGVAITGQLISLRYQVALVGDTSFEIPAPGIRTRFLRDIIALAPQAVLAFLKQVSKTISATAPPVVTIARQITAFRTISVLAPTTATITKQIPKVISATATTAISILAQLPIGRIPGSTAVKKIIAIFDD